MRNPRELYAPAIIPFARAFFSPRNHGDGRSADAGVSLVGCEKHPRIRGPVKRVERLETVTKIRSRGILADHPVRSLTELRSPSERPPPMKKGETESGVFELVLTSFSLLSVNRNSSRFARRHRLQRSLPVAPRREIASLPSWIGKNRVCRSKKKPWRTVFSDRSIEPREQKRVEEMDARASTLLSLLFLLFFSSRACDYARFADEATVCDTPGWCSG